MCNAIVCSFLFSLLATAHAKEMSTFLLLFVFCCLWHRNMKCSILRTCDIYTHTSDYIDCVIKSIKKETNEQIQPQPFSNWFYYFNVIGKMIEYKLSWKQTSTRTQTHHQFHSKVEKGCWINLKKNYKKCQNIFVSHSKRKQHQQNDDNKNTHIYFLFILLLWLLLLLLLFFS